MIQEQYYPRGQLESLKIMLSESPVVFIQGPRQSGKTTLSKMIQSNSDIEVHAAEKKRPTKQSKRSRLPTTETGYQYYTMDDASTRIAAWNDPTGFVKNLPDKVILDEVQRVPDLFLEIKAEVDRDRRAGRFLLTGSTHAMSSPKVSESLAGRMALLRLHPLSQKEIVQGKFEIGTKFDLEQSIFDLLLTRNFETKQYAFDYDSLPERIVTGGFPEALELSSFTSRKRWYRNYIDLICQRDILDLTRVRMMDILPDTLLIASQQNAQLFNIQRIAHSLNVSWPTMRDYVTLLKKVYLLDELQPFHRSQMKRLVKTPKLHIGDSGLACSLLSLNSTALESDRKLFGQMLENFVYLELVRQASWEDDSISFHHYRDKDQKEVDIVMEVNGRKILGVEVKASRTVRRRDFTGLRKLQTIADERFVAGAILYCGDMCIAFEKNMFALPVGILWD